jgi:hypothetical protein
MNMKLHRIAAPAAAFGLIAIVSASAGAQTDSRWRAWTGCWTPVSAQAGVSPSGAVCVLPTEKPSAVEIVTISGNTITDRTRVDADGAPRTVTREGCTGTETARWSTTGTRVQVTETMACAGGLTRRGTGIISFDQTYQWLDVRGVTSGNASGVAVARYQMLTDTTGLPAEVRPVLAPRSAVANSAMLAASAPLTLADIAEVATATDSGVAATWLMERTRSVKLSVDGKQLAMLADQGVPAAVIDVLVAIAHPRVFALAGADPQMREAQRANSTANSAWRSYPSYYNPYFYGYYDPFYSGFYGYYDRFSGYGYRYGYGYNPYGYGYGYSGYYPGVQPVIVVNRTDEQVSRPHGRVTRDRGYTSGEGSSSGGKASGGSSSTSSSSGGSTGSGSTGTGGSGGSSSGSSGGGDRTAVRKPPA